jgi:opine dehydrogenase
VDVAVIGNSAINSGFAVAADLAMAGHAVRLAAWPGAEATLEPIRRRGGIELAGLVDQLLSRTLGLATPRLADTPAEALKGARLVYLDMPAPEFEERFATLIPHLEPGQVVHVNIHGYWPALRLAPLLRRAGREDVTLIESTAPSHAAEHADGAVKAQWLRRKLPIATFPADRHDEAFRLVSSVNPTVVPALNVLETSFAGINMMIHAAMSMLNIGWFDRAVKGGEAVYFYRDGNTPHTGKLTEAQDAERRPVCTAYDVAYRPLAQDLRDFYDAKGDGVHELVRGCPYYQALAPYPTEVWKRWMTTDVAHAHVPFVAFAEVAGIVLPLHRAIIAVMSALLGRDFATDGVTLGRLGLAGLDVAAIKRYVQIGKI